MTIAWNAAEGGLALAAGILAHSIALVGFGLDSSIEVLASGVAVWQLRHPTRARSRVALRLIGASFLLVAAYVGAESVRRLLAGGRAHPSSLGIAVTSASVPAMAGLGVAKRRVAVRLSNVALRAEAIFTLVDAVLSATVLVGLVVDRVLGWWWADPVAGIAVGLFAAREGVKDLSRRA